ncbi:MAG: hypothetical protein VKO39_12210 [Cyanobacteriota bacterium]|nr:hypothetical protein [Cyanobacteriota bacterium]
MKSTAQIVSSTLALGAIMVLTQAPQQASALTIDFGAKPVGNVPNETFPSNPAGISLDVTNPNTFGPAPLPTTFNVNSSGLCAWAESGGPTAARCGYDTAGNGIQGFKFKFDQPTTINSFLLAAGAGVQNIASATIGFSLDGITYNDSPAFGDAQAGSTIALTNPFSVPANTEFFVRSSATRTAGSLGGVVRISQLNVVPGPLPILGVAGAYGWSKRLKRRIQTAALR